MRMRAGLALTGLLVLAACGGSNGASGIASTPPPPPSYTKLADLTGNQTIRTSGVGYSVNSAGFRGGTVEEGANGITVAYDAATDSYTLSDSSGVSESFGPVDLISSVPGSNTANWRKLTVGQNSNFMLTVPTVNGVALSYTAFGGWSRQVFPNPATAHLAVGGIPTVSSDMPRSGIASYTTSVSGVARLQALSYALDPASTATFTANFGNGTVASSLNLVGANAGLGPLSATLTGTGTIASTSSTFSGTLSGGTGSGVFAGGFFGPQAIEMGYNFYFRDDGAAVPLSAVGSVAGIKQ